MRKMWHGGTSLGAMDGSKDCRSVPSQCLVSRSECSGVVTHGDMEDENDNFSNTTTPVRAS